MDQIKIWLSVPIGELTTILEYIKTEFNYNYKKLEDEYNLNRATLRKISKGINITRGTKDYLASFILIIKERYDVCMMTNQLQRALRISSFILAINMRLFGLN